MHLTAHWTPVAAIAVLASVTLPATAHGEWRKAETAHFVVYSDGAERTLREYAVKLERFDALMRRQLGVPTGARTRKLPVYLLGGPDDLARVRTNLPRGIGGFYTASEEDIFAVLRRDVGDDILLHEYAHHFMHQHFAGGYPGWFVEGFAEYFMPTTVTAGGKATVGYFNPGRLAVLNRETWIPMVDVLKLRPLEIEGRDGRGMYYAQSWLLTHYMLSDPDRLQRLDAYLTAVSSGATVEQALQSHFGLTPETLTRQLKTYLNGRLPYLETDIEAVAPSVEITRLSRAADDLMLAGLSLRYTGDDQDGTAQLARIRTQAAAHPGDVLAQTTLARAELKWGTAAAAEAALTPVLTQSPEDVEALRLMAQARLKAARDTDDPAQANTLTRQARGFLARAYAADPTDYRIYAAIARSRRDVEGYPDDNDLELWRNAVALAPQVRSIRGEAGEVLMRRALWDEARALLIPLANDPHGGPSATRARERLEQIATRSGAAAPAP